MQRGAPVWVRDQEEAWVRGTIIDSNSDSVKVEIFDEEHGAQEKSFSFSGKEDTELQDVKLANEEDQDLVDDLIQLPHLHEAAILHSLTQRFDQGTIYTFTANAILLAVNPFQRLPLYGQDQLQEYFNQGYMRRQGIEPGVPLGPHVFAIADSAYRDMMRGIHMKTSGGGANEVINQSILISGESGAGKTESTKYVMKYLTTVGNGSDSLDSQPAGGGGGGGSKAMATKASKGDLGTAPAEGGGGGGSTGVPSPLASVSDNNNSSSSSIDSVMDKVMQSNPILEAFGNARTIRNDNSSRFGKFIELMFDKRGKLLGASIETYLLEKVRLPNQSENERNFHVFYQMTKGASEEQRQRWGLGSPEEYCYTNQGNCYDLRHVDDEELFSEMLNAMGVMGFTQEDRDAILDTAAAVLHLGELEFTQNEDSSSLEDTPACQQVCRLLSLSKERLEQALTTKTIEVMKQVTRTSLLATQASDARDALAKALYGRLFDYIVASINTNIACDRKAVMASVGVLDIFGFECFQHNSFEQLCINYTNETLQQQFNQFVFKMEQKEYTKEAIEWSFVEFPDNQDCLDLIEGRPNGLLTMLDDECRMGIRGSDKNYALRLYKDHAATPRITFNDHSKAAMSFGLRHYAGNVVYSMQTFLDKNRDELPKETDELFCSSTSGFVKALFSEEAMAARGGAGGRRSSTAGGSAGGGGGGSGGGGSGGLTAKGKGGGSGQSKSPVGGAAAVGNANRKPTVASGFKEQLHALMELINQTRPHYIRCIKPNDLAEPSLVQRVRVMEQLRYGGVLEAVRVARSGFPVRMPHKDTYARYRMLLALDPDHQPNGKKNMSKNYPVHVRNLGADGAKKKTEELVKNVLCPAIQRAKNIPGDTIQFGKTKVFLRKNAHDTLELLRAQSLTCAATTLQRYGRGYVYRHVYQAYLSAVRHIQRWGRGMVARRKVQQMRENRAAVRVQTATRCYLAFAKYQRIHRAILRLQARHRGRFARVAFRVMIERRAARKMQAWGRGNPTRRRYRRLRCAVVALQCRQRRSMAMAALKKLKLEAKDVGNLKESNEKLKEEVRQLREMALRQASSASKEQAENAQLELGKYKEQVDRLTKRVGELEHEVVFEKKKTEQLVKEKEVSFEEHEAEVQRHVHEYQLLQQEQEQQLERLQYQLQQQQQQQQQQQEHFQMQLQQQQQQQQHASSSSAQLPPSLPPSSLPSPLPSPAQQSTRLASQLSSPLMAVAAAAAGFVSGGSRSGTPSSRTSNDNVTHTPLEVEVEDGGASASGTAVAGGGAESLAVQVAMAEAMAELRNMVEAERKAKEEAEVELRSTAVDLQRAIEGRKAAEDLASHLRAAMSSRGSGALFDSPDASNPESTNNPNAKGKGHKPSTLALAAARRAAGRGGSRGGGDDGGVDLRLDSDVIDLNLDGGDDDDDDSGGVSSSGGGGSGEISSSGDGGSGQVSSSGDGSGLVPDNIETEKFALDNDDVLIQKLMQSLDEEREERRQAQEEVQLVKHELAELKALNRQASHFSLLNSSGLIGGGSAAPSPTGGGGGGEDGQPVPHLFSGRSNSFKRRGGGGGGGGGMSSRSCSPQSFTSSQGEAFFKDGNHHHHHLHHHDHHRPLSSHHLREASGFGSGTGSRSRSGSGMITEESIFGVGGPIGGTYSSINEKEPMEAFEQRVLEVQQQLHAGVQARLWDGKVQHAHVCLKLKISSTSTSSTSINSSANGIDGTRLNRSLTRASSNSGEGGATGGYGSSSYASGGGTLSLKFESMSKQLIWRSSGAAPSVLLTDQVKVRLGHGNKYGLGHADDDTCFTIAVENDGKAPADGRVIVIKVLEGGKTKRNELVSGLRKLIAQAMFGAVTADMKSLGMKTSDLGGISKRALQLDMDSAGSSTGGGGGGGGRRRPSADLAAEEMSQQITLLEKQLLEEHRTSENIMVQMLEMTNTLNSKDDLCRKLARELEDALEDVKNLQRVHRDNSGISMRLNKRMELLEFENDEMKQENAMLKEKLVLFKEGLKEVKERQNIAYSISSSSGGGGGSNSGSGGIPNSGSGGVGGATTPSSKSADLDSSPATTTSPSPTIRASRSASRSRGSPEGSSTGF